MRRESNPGIGLKVSPADALAKAERRLAEINKSLETAAQNPSVTRFYDKLRETKQEVREEIKKLRLTI